MDPDIAGKAHPVGAGRISPASSDRLDSWKDIAAFVGRDVRTAMRWAKEQGMPVHRIPGSKRSRVYASRTEISRWLSRGSDSLPAGAADLNGPPERAGSRPGTPRKYWIAVALICPLALLVFTTVVRRRPQLRVPARVRFTENTVQALDDEGRQLWTHTFSRQLDRSLPKATITDLTDFVRIADLMGDGQREVVIVAPFVAGPNPTDGRVVEVDCLSSGGVLLWSYTPQATFTFGGHELRGPWSVYDLMVSHDGPKRWI